jgi:hypothetical protein
MIEYKKAHDDLENEYFVFTPGKRELRPGKSYDDFTRRHGDLASLLNNAVADHNQQNIKPSLWQRLKGVFKK